MSDPKPTFSEFLQRLVAYEQADRVGKYRVLGLGRVVLIVAWERKKI